MTGGVGPVPEVHCVLHCPHVGVDQVSGSTGGFTCCPVGEFGFLRISSKSHIGRKLRICLKRSTIFLYMQIFS